MYFKVLYHKKDDNKVKESILRIKETSVPYVLNLLATYVKVLSFDKVLEKEDGFIEVSTDNKN